MEGRSHQPSNVEGLGVVAEVYTSYASHRQEADGTCLRENMLGYAITIFVYVSLLSHCNSNCLAG